MIYCIFLITSFFPDNSIADTKIRVGVYPNRPLLFKDSDGNVKGIFADILNYVAAKEGWTLEYVSKPWAQCIKDLKSGQLDILGAIAYSEKRNQSFDFTYENIISNWGQIYTGKSSNIKSILDFKGKKIAVLQNDIYYKELRKIVKKLDIECRFTEAFDYEAVLELVEAGKCDAGLVNYLYGHQYDRKYNINRSSIILGPQKIHFAVPKGKNWELISALDLHVRNLKKDKSSIYYQSLSRWIGVDSKRKDPLWVYGAGAGAAGLILLVLVLNMILRSQVRKRTEELKAKNQVLIYEIERRKKVEAALQKNESKYRNIIENIEEGFFELDMEGNLTFFNNSLCKITGYSHEELMGLNYRQYSCKKTSEAMFKVFNQVFSNAQPIMVADFEIELKDRGPLQIDLSAAPILDNEGRVTGFRGLMRDVSERKKTELETRKLEKKLQQAQKMKAIGTLAGGVAHDLNNILSGIVSYPDLILMDLP